MGGGLWLGLRLGQRTGGAAPRKLSPRQRLLFVVFMLVACAITAAVVVSFAAGKPGIGIAILVAFYILPTFVTTPLAIRRSRRRAEAARLARQTREHGESAA